MSEAPTTSGGDDLLQADLVARAEPIVTATGLELIEIELKGSKGRRVVRVIVDGDDGVDVDDCATISRALGESLEENDPFDGAFTLEVTSPGATRPLSSERDFRRNIGRDVKVQRHGHPEVAGTIEAVTAETVTLTVDGESTQLQLEDIDHAKVLLPW